MDTLIWIIINGTFWINISELVKAKIGLRHVRQGVSIVPCFETESGSILSFNHEAYFIF